METDRQKDRIRGSLIGGAAGDALGYPVEFYSYGDIQARYGTRGMTRLLTGQGWKGKEEQTGKALISDDTQMTLFTACGILNAKENGSAPLPSICEAYIEWYYTQKGIRSNRHKACRIRNIPELNQRRAPGNTCMSAIAYIIAGQKPCNNSKGCGGVMRIAPIALYGASQNRIADIKALDLMAADAARLTHLHPLGYIPAALVSHLIYRLATDGHPDKETFKDHIREGLETIKELFADHQEDVETLTHLIRKAILLSDISTDDVSTIENELGGGWVAEETAAIAIYCALKHFDCFEEALIAAVNHGGDSDSTGAVTGNILGAALGYEAIPSYYKTDLELHDLILQVADDLYEGKNSPCTGMENA